MKTQLCRDMELEDEDIFCRYCGALTTYAVERKADGESVPPRAEELNRPRD